MFSRLRKIFTEYKELRYLAYHDSLTGLLNRNWLYKNIDKLNYKYVYFVDINDLHKANKHGHTFGDQHIIKCVNAIKIAENDVLIRYAGDEFILITNDTNIYTNELYAVGKCEIKGCLTKAINIADKAMLESKAIYKKHLN